MIHKLVIIGNAISSIYTAQRIKEERPDSIIIFGGPEAYLNYRAKLYLKLPFIDLLVYYPEGEIPLLEILTKIKDDTNIYTSHGIGFLKNKKIIFTDPPNKLNLNDLPIPRYDLLEEFNLKNIKTLDILTAKGCLNKCVFCNENSIWGDFRIKSPQKIYNEIEYYINKYGIYNFEIIDNAFNLSNSFKKALDLLYNSNIKINWGGNCEISNINEKNILKYIERGLSHCFFGLESASPKILNLMGKKFNLDKFSKLLYFLMTADVRAYLYIMVGFPNENGDDFEKTINFLKENGKNIENIIVSIFSLMKSSPIFNSNLIKPIALSPPELNAWTYETIDGISHKDRMKRFLIIKKMWKEINL